VNDRAVKYRQAVKGGQLSRREFMAIMAAAGISSASTSALFGSEDNAAMMPKRGGDARVGFRGTSV
jgi:hypothetical protein